ncbi:hypothetical protein H8356DRAFT_1073295 [Neocallimastix lanati (nom. inval.)]|nr:hypothetical protein H8356DRAFT_1073295 [Neocallimastix sp. JGI-2020a]
MSVVLQISEEEKRISNTLTPLVLQEINSVSFMKTSMPNDEQYPSHVLSPAPMMLNIKPIPILNELDFRDIRGNYSTSTDDMEFVNITEESSIEIPYNSLYNYGCYNGDSYNS